jgi:hypothetical protein
MKWKYFPIADNDPRAKKQVLENLSMGAYKHTLTRKLLTRFSEAAGQMVLVAFDSLDLNYDRLYAYATYDGGKGWFEAAGGETLPQEHCPIGGLVAFVENYLRSSSDAVAICENWAATPKDLADWPRESRVAFFAEEVYHVLTSAETTFDAIETAIRESTHHWATGVCSYCQAVPQGDVPTEAFFDTIVANTAHIFTPALDGEGYLIWSPIRVAPSRSPTEKRREAPLGLEPPPWKQVEVVSRHGKMGARSQEQSKQAAAVNPARGA